jgi:hypothetical protein
VRLILGHIGRSRKSQGECSGGPLAALSMNEETAGKRDGLFPAAFKTLKLPKFSRYRDGVLRARLSARVCLALQVTIFGLTHFGNKGARFLRDGNLAGQELRVGVVLTVHGKIGVLVVLDP